MPDSMKNSIHTVGGDGLKDAMSGALIIHKFLKRFQNASQSKEGLGVGTFTSKHLRALSFIPDKEMKTRVIAIGDY